MKDNETLFNNPLHISADKLLQIEEFTRDLVSLSPVGILYLNQNGEVIYTNPRLVEMLDTGNEYDREATEELITEILVTTRMNSNKNIIETVLSGINAEVEEIEYSSLKEDRKWMNLYASPKYDENLNVIGAMVVCVNVTGSKGLKEQLFQSQKMEAVGQLASGVAHDFNNILTVISGHTELLQMSLREESPLQENIFELQKATDSATHLVSQLMEFSRKRPTSQSELNVNSVIVNMRNMIQRLLTENISLITNLDKSSGKILANKGQLEQVLINLAVNAQHAMNGGGKLIIESQMVILDNRYCRVHADVQPGKYVMLSVSDTGCGMSDNVKSKIFDPFFTTRANGKGTGLGLSTVYGIVKQNHGHITVYSELEKGTTFKIYLPIVRNEIPVEPRHAAEPELKGGNETILLVEDENSVRKVAIDMLSELGYSVHSAINGKHALELFDEYRTKIELVITDLGMPDIGGNQLVRIIRSFNPDLKVVFMSGHTKSAVIHQGRIDPSYHYIQKPFQYAELAGKIREVFDKPSLSPEEVYSSQT